METNYEEIQGIVVSILTEEEKTKYGFSQFRNLESGVNEVLARRRSMTGQSSAILNETVVNELTRDVFWDLFRRGYITLGMNSSNENWPFFRLSHFGKNTLGSESPWRFHDTSSYLGLFKEQVTELSGRTIDYLEEAISTFYSGALLASTVMLGVAAEIEFLRLLEVAIANKNTYSDFSKVDKERTISGKISKFIPELKKIPRAIDTKAFEDIDVNLLAIQSILRIARNQAGHPSSARPTRESVYVNLQIFVPFALQMVRLRSAISKIGIESSPISE